MWWLVLRFGVRELNWWVAVDGAGRWSICRHVDGYFAFGWSGVVDGEPGRVEFCGYRRRGDVLAVIEQMRGGIEQVVRDRRMARKEAV